MHMIRGLSAHDILRSRGVAGLGAEPSKREQAMQKLGIFRAVVDQASAGFPIHKARLKAEKNWWADNFEAKKKEAEDFILDVQAKIATTANATVDFVTVWRFDLERLDRDTKALMDLRDLMESYRRSAPPAQKPPSGGGAAKPPPSSDAATTDLAPPPPEAEAGGSNTMMYVGIGVAALLILMAFSGEE